MLGTIRVSHGASVMRVLWSGAVSCSSTVRSRNFRPYAASDREVNRCRVAAIPYSQSAPLSMGLSYPPELFGF